MVSFTFGLRQRIHNDVKGTAHRDWSGGKWHNKKGFLAEAQRKSVNVACSLRRIHQVLEVRQYNGQNSAQRRNIRTVSISRTVDEI